MRYIFVLDYEMVRKPEWPIKQTNPNKSEEIASVIKLHHHVLKGIWPDMVISTRITLELKQTHTWLMLYDPITAKLEWEGFVSRVYKFAWDRMTTLGGQPFIGCRSINLQSDETEDSAEREANSCHKVDWTDGKGD